MLAEITRYWTEVLQPFKPLDWTLENNVIYENNSLKLRLFTPTPKTDTTPVLLLAPNAGHHQNISEPLIGRCLRIDSERPIYLVDWIEPTRDSVNRFDSINDIILNIRKCVNTIGGKTHLITLCQGAWAGAIYTALYPETIVSYTNAAGPIDFHAGDGKIKDICQTLPMSFFENMVAINGGVQRGEYQLLGFKSLNPYDRYVGDYLDLWQAVCEGSEEKIQRWRRFKEWYDQPVDLAGVWYLEAVDKLFKRNLLVKGELEVLGENVDLKKIACPVSLIAGENDDITPAPQVFSMAKYVSGPTTMKVLEGAGHVGVFTKKNSLDYWEAAVIRKLDEFASFIQKSQPGLK